MYTIDKDTMLLMVSITDVPYKHGRHVNSTIHQFRAAKDHIRLKKKREFYTSFVQKISTN